MSHRPKSRVELDPDMVTIDSPPGDKSNIPCELSLVTLIIVSWPNS